MRRLVGLTAAGALLLAAVGVGPVAAANPTWNVTFDRLPNVVAPGNDAGWLVTVINTGPSQINDLNITITAPDATGPLPSYISDLVLSSGGTETCSTATGVLVCNVGTVYDDGTITFTVAFGVPDDQTGSFTLDIGLVAGTGDTGSDGPGKSRGDKKTFSNSTPVNASVNFDGGFVLQDGAGVYSTNPNVGRRNLQATTIDVNDELIGVTIEDGIANSPCDGTADPDTVHPACNGLFGEWSAVNVNDGQVYLTPFRGTLLVSGTAVAGGTDVEDIVLVHVLDDGTVEVIGDTAAERCASATTPPTTGECIYVEKVGGNYLITFYLLKNGTLRGGI
jgi:hypothetical protein